MVYTAMGTVVEVVKVMVVVRTRVQATSRHNNFIRMMYDTRKKSNMMEEENREEKKVERTVTRSRIKIGEAVVMVVVMVGLGPIHDLAQGHIHVHDRMIEILTVVEVEIEIKGIEIKGIEIKGIEMVGKRDDPLAHLARLAGQEIETGIGIEVGIGVEVARGHIQEVLLGPDPDHGQDQDLAVMIQEVGEIAVVVVIVDRNDENDRIHAVGEWFDRLSEKVLIRLSKKLMVHS